MSRKLSGEATASELTELNDLIKTQANEGLYIQAIDEYWQIPPEKDEEFLEATYHLHLNRLKQKGFDLEKDKEKEEAQFSYFNYRHDSSGKTFRKKPFIAISVLSVLAFLFFIFYNFKNSTVGATKDKMRQSEVSTKTGSRTKIQLPDGTSVWLNGSSKLVYDNLHFGEKIREVELTGEGYFDVVKNKDKPFIIHANRINIKVLGTAFNVKAYPGDKNTETSLIRGSIEVTMNDRKGKIMMKPNDKLIISNEETPEDNGNATTKKAGTIITDPYMSMGHLTHVKDENTVMETAWVENKLVFDNETFEDVAVKMERWYGVSIHIADDQLKTQRLTGTFEKETVTEALMALQISTPIFKYKINNQSINIFK